MNISQKVIKVASVFSGIGSPEFALLRANIPHKLIFACDNGEIECLESDDIIIDKIKNLSEDNKRQYIKSQLPKKVNFVKKSFLANYALEEKDFHHNVRFIDGNKYRDMVDLFIGGSPCQSFTLLGHQKGLEEARGTLFYEFARLVKEIQPKAFIYENVQGLVKHDGGRTWEVVQRVFNSIGYNIYSQVLDAVDFGIPQKRRRIFVVGFKTGGLSFQFPQKKTLTFTMQDFDKQTSGNRRYLYGLDKNGFSIRNFLIADHSYITFLKEDDGSITLRFTTESLNTSNQTNSIITKRTGLTKTISTAEDSAANYEDLLTAMRTKPFLLLAGISGTGKSRIVKQMAFESCPDIPALRSDKTAPGNYELIEVKPNWHDSSELLGYESEIGGPHYVVTPFVRFLVKAMRYPDVPFFVCMDEMNLAPVEQYFAEFLSVLESRKLLSDGTITSEPLIKADIFSKYADQLHRDLDITDTETYKAVYDRLKNDGLRLPSNLIVVGTVNMDETTHQFSRKVIDRAMTIEMNIEDAETPFKNFFEGGDALHYYDNPQPKDLFLPKVVQASEALSILSAEDASYLKENVPGLLHSLNSALNGTPFKIAYRVQNELILYFFSLREENPDEAAEALLAQAMDAILMMKVLPRIEGDEDLLDKPLKALAQFTENYPQASRKIAEMQERLPQAHFTCFWP